MFGYGYGGKEVMKESVCKPDYEDQLKRVRERTLDLSQAKEHLVAFIQCPLSLGGEQEARACHTLLGEIELGMINLKNEEIRLLEEIDKDD